MLCQSTVHELLSLHKKLTSNFAQYFGGMKNTIVMPSEKELPLLTLNAKFND